MDEQNIQVMTDTTVKAIGDGDVTVESEGQQRTIPADYVILAQNRKAYNPLGEEIRKIVGDVFEVLPRLISRLKERRGGSN